MNPSVGLAVEVDCIVGGEEQARLSVGEVRENAAGLAGLGREDAARCSGGDVGELDRPGVERSAVGGELGDAGEGCA
jgi:hypothetical protein